MTPYHLCLYTPGQANDSLLKCDEMVIVIMRAYGACPPAQMCVLQLCMSRSHACLSRFPPSCPYLSPFSEQICDSLAHHILRQTVTAQVPRPKSVSAIVPTSESYRNALHLQCITLMYHAGARNIERTRMELFMQVAQTIF